MCLRPSEDRDPRAESTHRVSQRLHAEAVIEHLCPSVGRDKQKMLENELSGDKIPGIASRGSSVKTHAKAQYVAKSKLYNARRNLAPC